MTVNPLVVPRLEQPVDAWSGVWIAEDIQLLAQGVRNRSWVEASLGGAAAGLDTLAFVSDPVSSLLQYGIAWLIEHVRPLTEALDWLAGDPATIAAHSGTWHNIAGSVRAEASALADAVRADVPDWHGPAAIAYRLWNREQHGALHTLADGADTMALITETAGVLVAGVRVLVRDAIAIAVSRLIVYAVELIATGLLATPVVIEQVATTVAACAAKIARFLRALIASLRRLVPTHHRLAQHATTLEEILKRLTKGTDETPGGATRQYPKLDDPGIQKGPLGPDFQPGTVVDPQGLFNPEERAIADRLAQDGYMVHARKVDQSVEQVPNPDAMLRLSPDDPGTVTEFKTLEPNKHGEPAQPSAKVRDDIRDANGQVRPHGGGYAVIDGRGVDLTEADARRGYARAVGNAQHHGIGLPEKVLIVLGNNSILELPDR